MTDMQVVAAHHNAVDQVAAEVDQEADRKGGALQVVDEAKRRVAVGLPGHRRRHEKVDQAKRLCIGTYPFIDMPRHDQPLNRSHSGRL